LEEDQRVQLFTGGLLPPLSHVVCIHNPTMLAAAMSLARQVELMELERVLAAFARATPHALLPAPAIRQAPATIPAAPVLPAPAVQALPAPPIRGRAANPPQRLSAKEQAERCRLGLCYNCNEPYSRAHNHTCRRIFYIDGVELDEGGAEEEASVFSLHAVAGVPDSNTI
jgi:hypothetical protein